MLKKLRLGLAVLVGLGFLSLYMNFFQAAPWTSFLARIQFVPAVLTLSLGTVAVWLVITLLFGRVYCSCVCPLGIAQDLFSHFGAKLRRQPKFQYAPANSRTRYIILILYIASLAVGFHLFFTLLSPYALFGRCMTLVVHPLAVFINNNILLKFSGLDVFGAVGPVEHAVYGLLSSILALALAVAILAIAWFKGRWYCNTICPVGTFLGILSQRSWKRIGIDADKCVKCGACSRLCKSACLNIREGQVDNSRCVKCFNCLYVCPKGAISFTSRPASTEKRAESETAQQQLIPEQTSTEQNAVK